MVKRATNQYLPQAQKLYDWLVRPYATDLAAAGGNTLVFVPDGALRTIPAAALHDGSAFLVERYAVAVTPGLELTNPAPVPRGEVWLLAAGGPFAHPYYWSGFLLINNWL